MSAAARRLAHSTITGSGVRSKRYDEGLASESPRAAARTTSGANWADSRSTSVVAAPISVSAPPMTPARATGRSASAITPIVSSSVYCLWLIAVKASPAAARRTTIFPPRIFARSNACSGWPHSNIT